MTIIAPLICVIEAGPAFAQSVANPAGGLELLALSGSADAVADGATTGDETGATAVEPAAPDAGSWTLAQLIDRAVRSNPRVLGLEQGQAAAKAGVTAARWEYFPSPQVQVETNAQDRLITSTLTQPLYAFGKLGATLAAARAQSNAAGYRTGETRRETALRVLEQYSQYASLTRGMAVLEGDIARHLELEAMIQRRVESGVSAPVDLNLVQTRLNQSRISRVTLQARKRAALAALSQLVGVALAPETIRLPTGEDRAADGFLADQLGESDLVQRSLDRNPALQRADAEIAAAQAEARRARAVMLPTIVARLENRTYTSGYPANGLPDTRVTIGVSLSTGAGLASFAGARAAEARAGQAALARDALQLDLTSTVIAALESFNAARKTVEGLRQNKLVQEQTAESYHRMFLVGKRSWLDVLNMVREQTSIERDVADAEVQLMVADYRLRIEAGDIA